MEEANLNIGLIVILITVGIGLIIYHYRIFIKIFVHNVKKLKTFFSYLGHSRYLVGKVQITIAIFTIFLLILSSLILYFFTDRLFDSLEINIVIFAYAFFLVIKYFTYKLIFKKFSFSESQYYKNSFIPLFLIPIELPFVLIVNNLINFNIDFLSDYIPFLTGAPNIILTLLIFVFFSLVVFKFNIFSHKFKQINVLRYYIFLIIEMILSSLYFYSVGLFVLNLSAKTLYLTREIVIFSILVYQFYTYITLNYSTILKAKSPRNVASVSPGSLIKIYGAVTGEVFIKEKSDFFVFKFEKILKYYKINSESGEFLFVYPEISHFHIDRLTLDLQQGDVITLIGVYYVKSFFEHKEMKYINPLFLHVDEEAFSRKLL